MEINILTIKLTKIITNIFIKCFYLSLFKKKRFKQTSNNLNSYVYNWNHTTNSFKDVIDWFKVHVRFDKVNMQTTNEPTFVQIFVVQTFGYFANVNCQFV